MAGKVKATMVSSNKTVVPTTKMSGGKGSVTGLQNAIASFKVGSCK